ncbi:MAG: hypothetical protein KBT48_04415, partial [Firmicutes bacterium]|nr:hypothetical protein [Bacillota bacterium]
VDVEIEKIHRRFETVPKMIIDLKNLSGQKVRAGENYIADTGIYLVFIYDCIKYEDELPIHTFIFKTEEGIELWEKDYVKWITVEIPKIREDQ